MKANEAPEKIWINPSMDLPKLNGVIDKDSVQYIRKDIVESMLTTAEVHAYFTGSESEREKLALKKDTSIEKALKFLDEKFYFNNLHYAVENNTFNCMEEMFEDFKNYMKGE